jgi:O-antigen/teichoic acid export membrane protein
VLKKRIKDIAKDSSIYGLSKVLGQVVSFFLIPLYTSYLSPEDYGILSIIGVMSVSLGLFMNFGLDSATYRYAALAKSEEEKKQYIINARFLVLCSATLFSIIYLLLLPQLNELLLTKTSPKLYLIIGLGLTLPATFSSVISASLRIDRNVKTIAISSLVNVFSSIISTIILVVYFKLGIVGALIGNLIGNVLSSLFVVIQGKIFYLKDINIERCKVLLKYSIPVLPAQLFAFAIPVYSQLSVKQFLSLNELGLYAVALKFTIPLTMGLTMFQQAYAPYKFQILKTDGNAKDTFCKIMNLFVIGFGLAVLLITLFGGEILRMMTTKKYHIASVYVFSIALIPFAQGLYFMCSTGLEFAKSPVFRPIISGLGFLTVLLTNHLLIKKFGVSGAAYSIVLSWLVMAIGNIIYAQKLYKINYNWIYIITIIISVFIIGYSINYFFALTLLMKVAVAFIILTSTFFVFQLKFNIKDLIKLNK